MSKKAGTVLEGKPKGKARRIGIVISRFNEFITNRLLDACLDELIDLGVSKSNITVVWVPGAFEIPIAACKLAKKEKIDAVICLGAVIRGETLHFELVAQGAAEGIAKASLSTEKPIIFEVLATETVDQAYKRSSEDGGENKGRDAAFAALEMISVLKRIDKKVK
ncbi:MAG: 6,7-dimethyl-8-ribityllumazine synthase [Candidatus Zapsychrus exili]|nr:6,7-dimethyl-8-ribityllumazine synthase [Candidatus Zapsychrus exili]